MAIRHLGNRSLLQLRIGLLQDVGVRVHEARKPFPDISSDGRCLIAKASTFRKAGKPPIISVYNGAERLTEAL